MKKHTLRRVTTCILVVTLCLVMLFSMTADALNNASAAGYIKQLYSVDTQYENFINSAVMQQLPSTIKDDDTISVIVMLDDPALLDTYEAGGDMTFTEYVYSAEGDKLRETVRAERYVLLDRLTELGISYETGEEYATVLAGYEILIQARYYDEVCGILGTSAKAIVGESYRPADTQLVENKVNVYETGIFDSSSFKYDGSGMVVAVLDTGLDYTHDAFSTDNFTSKLLGLTKEEVALVLGETNAAGSFAGLTADDVYVSSKVPFAFDYADKDPDVYSIHNNHGTHVSGVIAGKSDVITGAAPNAQIVSMKIFSDTYDSARASWILAALEDAVTLNVDVINMSLGTACGFSRESDEEALSGVYDRIREKGISLVVAASNSYNSAYGSEKNGNLGLTSNPDTGTVGSPSTYKGALSIASINGIKTPYILDSNNTIIYFVESSNSANDERNFFDDLLGDKSSVEMEYVLISGAGRPADYTDMDLTGKIALVRRGSTTFEEKANAAEKAGAAAVIIYNNTSGDIKMNVGTSKIPVCSISQDDGEMLAAKKTGTVKIARSQTSGPFMSDFSSWGPTPDLKIKPEITAHGGNILSAITGNEYDRLSGTSMACPNMSGVIALLRQYVIAEYPANEITYENGEINYQEVNAVVNRLLMSTADIIYNKNGLPYAVRKQGAGLANLTSSAATTAYILTYALGETALTRANSMDTTKIELGDDPTRSGVYKLTFSVYNFGSTTLTYDISTIVMTEGVSETPTYAGETVVSEEGYLLSPSTKVTCLGGGTLDGNKITVKGGATANITVEIKLSDADKKYLNDSFENGMYVEGFVSLDAVSGTEVDLSVPYLAFYGDWTEAPLFDIDYYETNADELDDSIATLDKNLADAYPTRPIGGIEDDYISYLGSYYFIQNPSDKIIAANRDYIAISNADGTIHSLRFVWMGMLRNAEKITVEIIDDATGEVVFETVEENVRKSYGDGGSTIYPANVDVEFDAYEQNLKNNTTYSVKVQGYLDYGNGGLETNENNTFEFPLTTDFEAPAITDVTYYTEYDRDAKKNRLFAEIAVYDNHYAMALQIGYITAAPEGSDYDTVFNTFSQYMTPVYSEKNSTTYVRYELTDYIYQIKENAINKNGFAITCYDYALNIAVYEIPLPDDYVDFYLEDTSITLNPNETYALNPIVYPGTEWGELLEYTSSNEKVVRIVNNKLVATGSGKATVFIYDPNNPDKEIMLSVTVRSPGDEGYRVMTKPVADEFGVISYQALKAYYQLSSEDRNIGEVGDVRAFDRLSLTMYPSESVRLNTKLAAFFPDDAEIVFSSGNDRVVSVNDEGVIVANEEGYASITVRVRQDGKNTNYTKNISIEVKDPFVRSGPMLNHYFGNGGAVTIPGDLLITEIGQYAFSNYNYVLKGPEDEISKDAPDATKMMFIGDNTITKVVIPEGVEKIGPYAFANLTALTEVVLPSTLKYIEYGAFFGCSALKTVKGLENVVTINTDAFYGCDLRGTISLDSAHAINDNAFAYNTKLEGVVIPKTLRSIGQYAFAGDADLKNVTIGAEKVKLGQYAFMGCRSLEKIRINASVIPTGTFYRCSALKSVTIGKDVSVIGEYAFAESGLTDFTVEKGNTTFGQIDSSRYLVSEDGSTLLLVAPSVSGRFELAGVQAVADGAFAGNNRITEVIMRDVTSVGKYAFADCTRLSEITLGTLTEISDYSFFNTPITRLPSLAGVSSIGAYAFAYTDIKEVNIPADMNVGEGAFCECLKLESVTIGDGATLGLGAFMIGKDGEHPRTGETTWRVLFYEGANGKRIYYYEYLAPMTSLTIGDNVVIGESAFLGAAGLLSVEMGDGVTIGKQAFYNASKLESIDLSGVISIGEMAFSGDVRYVFDDMSCQVAHVEDDMYVLKYYSPVIKSIDLSSITEFSDCTAHLDTEDDEDKLCDACGRELTAIGESAFLYCRELASIKLGAGVKHIPTLAFSDCIALTSINLEGVETIGDQAFTYAAITEADLSGSKSIGKYAFVYCEALESVTLREDGTDIGEGAFSYCTLLDEARNLNKSENIGAYAFTYTALTEIDLSGAITVGDHAFQKETLTPITLILGEKLTTLGDNPFAMCVLAPFSTVVYEEFNGVKYPSTTYTYDINDNIKIIDGSIYCVVPYGLELTTYIYNGTGAVILPEDTVRISAYAFAGSDVVRVTLPHALNSIGHKAFFECNSLSTVIFKSYEAPVLEEEFDMNYYSSYENLPATGTYIFQDYSGNELIFDGLGIVKYNMIEPYAHYSNAYYGANFVGYVGHYVPSLVMIRPSNGQHYESFIWSHYFNTVIDGGVAADDTTLEFIEAVNRMPNPVQLEDEALVIAAREAYKKIASTEQQALVDEYYALLISAELRIEAFKNTGSGNEGDDTPEPPVEEKTDVGFIVLLVLVIVESVIIVGCATFVIVYLVVLKKRPAFLLKKSEEVKPEATEGDGANVSEDEPKKAVEQTADEDSEEN